MYVAAIFVSRDSALIGVFHCRKQEELEARFIEEETQRRIDELVAERVAAELQKRKSEIEEEVLKRVEDAKRVMERQLVEEMERKQKQQEEEEERKKVSAKLISFHTKQLISSFVFCSSSLAQCAIKMKCFMI